ncbi:MAG: malonyl-ACP O-methyltransferase BioC [Candidatus Omnitrophica bacterium]|nr:malonyl-ACP O-methyltransferase BioC [Candidatus Omnitrophota bacterium]
MENMIDKAVICKNFSDSARSYDDNNGIQNEAGRMLVKRLPTGNIDTILEIGCGTGNYTRLLREAFKESKIKAIDISDEMIRVAKQKSAGKNTDFIAADIETAVFDEKFDLITSNAAFHWLPGFEKTIGKLQEMLTDGGTMAFSAFGPMTFFELKKSLNSVADKDVPMTSDLFHSKEKTELILKKYFKTVRITERLAGETYNSLSELLKKIKNSGTRGRGAGFNKMWSPDLLAKIENRYRERFGAIEATYQIFFCEAS